MPQIKKYFIAHELGKNVLLVNDMPVIGGSVELHNYDMITVGTTKLELTELKVRNGGKLMSKAYAFLKECGYFYVLTINENFPAGRPFGAVMEYAGKLFISTNDGNKVHKQLRDNGNIQILAKKDGYKDWNDQLLGRRNIETGHTINEIKEEREKETTLSNQTEETENERHTAHRRK